MKHTPEPWYICTTEPAEIRTHPYGGVIIGETIPNAHNAERAVTCVNACAGMADPATEIQAMREAIKAAEKSLRYVHGCLNLWRNAAGYNCQSHDADALADAEITIAKLKPLLLLNP